MRESVDAVEPRACVQLLSETQDVSSNYTMGVCKPTTMAAIWKGSHKTSVTCAFEGFRFTSYQRKTQKFSSKKINHSAQRTIKQTLAERFAMARTSASDSTARTPAVFN
jgi:hypothetical protein